MITEKEYLDAKMIVETYIEQLKQASVSGQVCPIFYADNKGTSISYCKFCGKEEWQHGQNFR